MIKKAKKMISVVLVLALALMCTVTAFAAEPISSSEEYQEYLQLVSDGILGDDITFDYWQELKERSALLETELEQSGEFSIVYDSTRASTYSMQAGDVFITNGTSSYGLTGHSGIAISSTRILHISGPGEHPSKISLATWNSNYTSKGWTKVYRHSSSTVASQAATWANTTYSGSNADYSITMNLASTDVTYCSKLVWQAYYYGPSTHCANGPTVGVRLPYDLPTTIHNISLINTFN